MKRIRVAVADDHPIVLVGIKGILMDAPDIEVSFLADNIKTLLEKVREEPIDVLVCDYEFEDDKEADGLNLLRRLIQLVPDTRVLFLSSHSATHIVSAALAGGAAGFIGKSKADFAVLADAIRRVHGGETYIPPSIATEILANVFSSRTRQTTGVDTLSPRELEVVRLICAGHSITEIAERVCRSPKTISNQKNAAMRKLAVRNDVELARAARDLGII
ncbi:response regulator transcription factor [Burkholderia dolosa]|jgi:two-component system capsular synthesis response regulator RcsB|uniref:response regulator transcription factor n=1 Tax=Burkholderia dolosa TaxID=152500 RepID=UPI001591D76C|nr:response regulator transcription factor [Burkholderia dolosa]MBR8058259.1 response regulator transcription factor [Burkholderia dolosa]MBR8299339.1 response regulator transcription factor [Burkholderia dolosa]MBR8313577.1 response regulator transcription factor [Burkholderia dolosa]MBR8456401.1 response regulator transcription factor [Burkholderia dolosa]MBY4753705.1 response regulator transcription factor [Burkholderia dolosa]